MMMENKLSLLPALPPLGFHPGLFDDDATEEGQTLANDVRRGVSVKDIERFKDQGYVLAGAVRMTNGPAVLQKPSGRLME